MKFTTALIPVCTAAALVACGGGGGGDTAPTGAGPGMGAMRVALTDAPSCGFDHVWVTVSKVSVHTSASAGEGEAGWTDLNVTPPRRVDLLALTNGVLEELGTTQLAAGSYSQVRLVLADNAATNATANAVQPTGGAVTPLETPSAQQSGLKLQTRFDVAAGQTADLVLDFDACRSVVRAGNSGRYNLKPVLSVTQRLATGIQGYVSTTLSPATTVVSAQQNGAIVRSTAPDSTGRFVIPFLAAGNYDVVVASDARSTAVVTAVPVTTATGTTVVSGTATAITPSPSLMATVTGTTSVTTTGTATAVVTDATVIAQQALTGGPTVTVATTPVDATAATYSLRLPLSAPMKAAYAASGPTFASDTAAAGKYTVTATAPSRTAVTQSLTLTGDTGASLVFGR